MSLIGDVMIGLRTVVELTARVERLEKNVEGLGVDVRDIDRRLVRLETIIEITRSDGATLRIVRDPE